MTCQPVALKLLVKGVDEMIIYCLPYNLARVSYVEFDINFIV